MTRPSTPPDEAFKRADESIAVDFSRIMKATTSRWGIATDPPIVAAATAVPFMTMLAYRGLGDSAVLLRLLEIATAIPIALAFAVFAGLSGARRRVVAWLAAVPFPVGNVNAVLNGVGDEIEIEFAGEPPDSAEVNRRLDEVHPDCFVTSSDPEHRTMLVRIGVVDSKRNPARTNHERYARVQELVARVFVPLAAEHPIVGARIQ